MNFRDYLKNNIVYFDGGMGTILQAKGLKMGELPERWNITHPEVICEIHKNYLFAGSDVITANTFGANILKFSKEELEEIITAAIKNAKKAILDSGFNNKFVALDIGPLGKLLKPLGNLDFEEAVKIFAITVSIGAKAGADIILIETMNDSLETKAAVLAAKENCDLPVVVSNAYSEGGTLMTGATPEAMVALLEGMGVTALGANCSLGPKELSSVAEKLLEKASVPVILMPNAGIPREENGKTVFDVSASDFAFELEKLAQKGLRIMGGCCGTTPEYIKAVAERTKNIEIKPIEKKNITAVSSYTHAVEFEETPVLIGERINPTGKKRFKQALIEHDIDYILAEGIKQHEAKADILDVNVGIPDIDEIEMLTSAVYNLQTVTDLPLQIDTSNALAMEKALRIYNGKAMINSVNGKKESMEAVFPLAKKYGGVVVALTLDENGIPDTALGRLEIAKKILAKAKEYGIDKKDIVFDTLAMTVSADKNAAKVTLDALKMIRDELGCKTSLGVSNVSFGLPNREIINSVFFSLALENGLSAAIMNPFSNEMMKVYYAFKALKGMDENLADYIENASKFGVAQASVSLAENTESRGEHSELSFAIIKGLKEKASKITSEIIISKKTLDIIAEDIVPALDFVGDGFEKKTMYLPQLLMSAEAAKAAFEVIKAAMPNENGASGETVVIATVHGDIHDIGKNIVKLLLANYGFEVIDLGKDVPSEIIADKVCELKAPYLALSALMTTTVPSMKQTIDLVRKKSPNTKILVGGAVLTEEYAEKIGADFYGKDALSAVKYLKGN